MQITYNDKITKVGERDSLRGRISAVWIRVSELPIQVSTTLPRIEIKACAPISIWAICSEWIYPVMPGII